MSKRSSSSSSSSVPSSTTMDWANRSAQTRAATTKRPRQQEEAYNNKFLSKPVHPQDALKGFLSTFLSLVRRSSNNNNEATIRKNDKNHQWTCCFELEARLGVFGLKQQQQQQHQHGDKPPQRIVSSKAATTTRGHVFNCNHQQQDCYLMTNVSKSHYFRTASKLRKKLGWNEAAMPVETVFAYSNGERAVFQGVVPTNNMGGGGSGSVGVGRWETKTRRDTLNLTLPEAPFDIRICSSVESSSSTTFRNMPIPYNNNNKPYQTHRIKRRRSYTQNHNPWRIDLTQVTTTTTTRNKKQQTPATDKDENVELSYEIEVELMQSALQWLLTKQPSHSWDHWLSKWAKQLWDILHKQLNPITPNNIEAALQQHPSVEAQALALARCKELRDHADPSSSSLRKPLDTLPSSMPVNFSRHHLDKMQWTTETGAIMNGCCCCNYYYCSEKTDGVRHWLIFTDGTTAVLVDRNLKCKQPVGGQTNPFGSILPLIRPGTVLDGEVVLNHGCSGSTSPRAVFIVFDVLAISKEDIVMSLPFEKRLDHLKQVSFCTKPENKSKVFGWNNRDPLPLLKKDFVQRTEIDLLLSNIQEDCGKRYYRHGMHNHLTDGIIFQPNIPYVCGTDKKLFKWKYPDELTIDVRVTDDRTRSDSEELRVIIGNSEENSFNIVLPRSERMRLEADRAQVSREAGRFHTDDCIAEVGFDHEMGEWYYVCIRGDKKRPNAIKTVVGTLQELAECLSENELRERLCVPREQKARLAASTAQSGNPGSGQRRLESRF